MELNFFLLFLGIALFAWLIGYGMGNPLAEKFDDKALLFFWPYYLAKKRAKKIDYYHIWTKGKAQDQSMVKSRMQYLDIERQYKKTLFETAREYFTWERFAGLCPVCLHFWLSIIALTFVIHYSLYTIIYFLITHFIIRKI